MSFSVPLLIPFLTALAAACLMAALRLRVTVSVFDLVDRREPLAEQASSLFRRIRSVRLLCFLLGPDDVGETLAMAGFPYSLGVGEFNLLRLAALVIAAAALCASLMFRNVFLLPLLIVVRAPDWWLLSLVSGRRKAMKRDFLVVATRLATAYAAGLDTYASLSWAAGGVKLEVSALRDELKRVLDKIRMDTPLEAVLEEFARRTGLLDARRLATVIVQAQRYGGSVADKLMDAVRDARERRKAEIIGQSKSAEQQMQLAVVVMALPTVICTLAPMAVSLTQQGGGLF
jgi:Flp pilus assembly protein TadB